MQLGNTLIFGKDLLGPAHCTVQPDAYLGLRPLGHLRWPTAACPIPRAPTRARPRRGGTVGRLPPHVDAANRPATSAPRDAHAAATSLCVPHLYPLRSCHVGAEFPLVFSPLASAPLLSLELTIATLPDHPLSSESGNQTPTFPSPCRTLLVLTPRTSGPRASSSPATASSASPATVDRRLRCSFGPVKPVSSIARALRCLPTSPTEPKTVGRPPHRCTPPPDRHRRHDRAPVSLPPPFTPNHDRRRPDLLPDRFPTDQRLPAGFGR
jgi:hypothetical protein